MRYERLTDIVRLAMRLQGARGGVTMDDIQGEFGISRRTAERMRNAVEMAFGPLIEVDSADKRVHWRLQSAGLRGLAQISPEEIAALEFAIAHLTRSGGAARRTDSLRELAVKLGALKRPLNPQAFDDDVETLMRAEGLAMRPGPRPGFDGELLPLIRDAIRASRKIAFEYVSRSSGERSLKEVEPYGVLYGNRAYLVGRLDQSSEFRLWRLPNMSHARLTVTAFEADLDFDLQAFAERSFGAYQEPPFDVVLRFDSKAAVDARSFVFHPSQSITEHEDGSVTVRFTAGGLDEMCFHLVTWGRHVTVEQPSKLRERLFEIGAGLVAHHREGGAA